MVAVVSMKIALLGGAPEAGEYRNLFVL